MLPQDFLDRMEQMLGEEYLAFWRAMRGSVTSPFESIH